MTMRTVHVDLADRSYDVLVGAGILDTLGVRVRALLGTRPAASLLTVDDNLPIDVVDSAVTSLDNAGLTTTRADYHAIETNKMMAEVERLCAMAVQIGLDRTCPMVALGGGIVGDVTGFAAASYMRGCPAIQCPTTLLAMVDASVGGKTGVNLQIGTATPNGDPDISGSNGELYKNMIGAFWQPKLVLCDIHTLRSLPDRELRAGFAECLKHGLLSGDSDAELFDWTCAHLDALLARDETLLQELVARNVAVKARVVEADEREESHLATGNAGGIGGTGGDAKHNVGRAGLNLGHTFAHTIETLPSVQPVYDDSRTHETPGLLHGEAVAIGLIAAAATAKELGLLNAAGVERVTEGVRKAQLPTKAKGLPANEVLLERMLHDKKTAGAELRLILPDNPTSVRLSAGPPLQATAAGWDAVRC